MEGGLCYFHANPDKAAELGRNGGRRRQHSYEQASETVAPPESAADVRRMLAETMSEVKAGRMLNEAPTTFPVKRASFRSKGGSMRKPLLLSVLLLACCAWVQAQAYPQSSATQATGGTSGSTTVQGCLSGSAGNYTLTADNGTTYTLTGNTTELKDHVGHEVQITGKTASSSSSASSTSEATAGAGQTLEVTSMKHLSKSCKSASKQEP